MFDQTRSNVLDGLLISDAYVPRNQNLLYFGQCADHREYVVYVAGLLGYPAERVRDRIRQPDKRTGKQYRCSELRTLSHPEYATLRQRWYRDGRKVVPGDLRVSAEFVLHWFLCDGSCSTSRSGGQLVLCTDSFTREEVEFLQSLLVQVGIESRFLASKRIRVRQKSIDRFYDYVGECPVECLAYKWIPLENRGTTFRDWKPHYERIGNLFGSEGKSCSEIAREYKTSYYLIYYILKTHCGFGFGKNAATETTCREGAGRAPSETARRASLRRVKTQSDLHGDMQRQTEMAARPPVAGHKSNS